ncbi:tudor domain-containing protein 10 isoform X2 [Mixophyes fleayi]|uniref:tudor domain-containing protein 10 isoform X2 n=2 Tax=Mixophyes fleayi TaxID=3061075 RepID=UPI003F4DBC16
MLGLVVTIELASGGNCNRYKKPMDFTKTSDDRVYAGNLPYDVREDDILTFFKDYEPRYVKKIQQDQKCFAFVQLSSEENAKQAIAELNMTSLNGRILVLKPFFAPGYDKRPRDRRPGTSQLQDMTSIPVGDGSLRDRAKDMKPKDQIVIRNLPFDVTDELENVLQSEPNNKEITGNSSRKRENKIYVDNLPRDVTKEDLFLLFKSYKPLCVWRPQSSEIRFAILEMCSCEHVIQAVKHLHGSLFKGSCLNVVSLSSKVNGLKQAETVTELPPMPALELVPQPHGEGIQADGTRNLFLIPAEMRGAFLADMLKDCFGDLSWLGHIMNVSGELAILMTNAYGGIPYFWAVLMSKEMYVALTNLCKSLVQMEPQLPYLKKRDVQRGTRCLARCILTEGEEGTWSRCWVVEVVSNLAVVFFLDYGLTDFVPVKTLRPLDEAQHWTTPPLAHPFLLEGLDTSDLMGTVVKGRICGSCSRERHILKFCAILQED